MSRIYRVSLASLLSILVALFIAACGGGDGAPQPPAAVAPVTTPVTVTAVDPYGAPLANTSVTVEGAGVSGTTDSSGRLTINVPFADAVNLKLAKAGYADKFEFVSVPVDAAALSVTAVLKPRAPAQTIANIQSGGSAAGVDGVRVTFPADTLVNAQGQPVTGAIEMFMTPVDVTGPDVAAFPGLFEGMAAGSRELLFSHGAAELVPTQGGQRLNLAPGRTAVVEIPLYADGNVDGTAIQLGEVMPFWSLNEATGVWTQEGTGEVVASSGSPTGKALRATVTHFSWWNIDVPAQRHTLNLTVVGPAACIPAGSIAVIRGSMVSTGTPAPGAPRPPVTGTASVSLALPVPLCATGVTRQIRLPAGVMISVSGSVKAGGVAYHGAVTAGGPAGATSSATVTLAPITTPTPMITAPAGGSVVAVGSMIAVTVEVHGPEPDRVEIFAGTSMLAQISPARAVYRVDWDTTGVAPGMVEMRAIAYRDSAVGSAIPVTVQIDAAPTPPVITSDVQDVTIVAGQDATFSVAATGASLQYDWRASLDGGATFQSLGTNASSLALSAVPSSANGQLYEVEITNFLGAASSRRARLTVNSPPQVSVSPQAPTVTAGQSVNFTASASGTAPLAYQWQRSNDGGATWAAIIGATSTAYGFTTVFADDGARFRAVATNAFGAANSNAAALSVTSAPLPPSISAHPQSLTLDGGATATFSVVASGTAPLAYQWQQSSDLGVSFANIVGATANSYSLPAVSLNDNSAWFRVLVSNSVSTVTSETATLTVNVFIAPLGTRITGASNTIALRATGTVWVWGSIPSANRGAPTQQLTPVQVPGLADIRSVAAGGNFQFPTFYALHQDGSVYSWGSNNWGQLGDGSSTAAHRQAPQAIPGLTRVIAIASAEYTGYALRDDGTVWSWGNNGQGQLGIGSAAANALTPQQIPVLANITSINAFDMIATAVRSDGALFAWGQGSNLTLPGVWPYSGGQRRLATQITEISGAVSAASGSLFGALFAITGADRSAFAWGSNTNGFLGVGTFTGGYSVPTAMAGNLQPWSGIRGCLSHAVGWTAAGLGYAWGQNNGGQIGDPAVGSRTATPNPVPGLDQVVEIGCGSEYHSIALRANGEVWTWGQNNRGQLGDGTTISRPSPVLVFNLAGGGI